MDLLAAAAIFVGGWYCSRLCAKLTRKALQRAKTDPLVQSFLGSTVRAVVLLVALISAVARMGINITSLVAALGAAGLTASFALQGSLSNLVSGMQIIFTKPFKMGDYLALQEYEGTVKRIEILYTTLATFDNKEIIVPNSKVTSDVVVNFTSGKTRRLDLRYTVSYRAELQKVKSVLEGLVREEPRILDAPQPVVAVGELGESGVTIVLKLWCEGEQYWSLYHDMQERVKLTFDRENIAFPFPQLDVHLDQTADKSVEPG